MINWRRVPWSLWAFVGLTTGSAAVQVVTVSAPVAPTIFFVVFILVWNVFLLRALRWLWLATVVLSVGVTGAAIIIGSGSWYGDTISLVELGLLVVPATRRFFSVEQSAATA